MSARKYHRSEAQLERLVGAFEAGADWATAAKLIGVSVKTLRTAIANDPVAAERIADARAAADEVVIKSLYTRATVDKDTTAMIFWLKNRRPDEWRDRRDFNIESKVDVADVTSPEARDLRMREILTAALARSAPAQPGAPS